MACACEGSGARPCLARLGAGLVLATLLLAGAAPAWPAQDRATLQLRGVVHRTVQVALSAAGPGVSFDSQSATLSFDPERQTLGEALIVVNEQGNLASGYDLILTRAMADGAAAPAAGDDGDGRPRDAAPYRLFFGDRPVVFAAGRAILRSARPVGGNGVGGSTQALRIRTGEGADRAAGQALDTLTLLVRAP
ncbi:MAG: hypothetical protein HY521_08045 [Proteobacteria bacterium]|nr:hypothetical protein [Pseudomonadota bacterium]